MMNETQCERSSMEPNEYGSTRDALPIALTIVVLAVYALFGIFMFTAILRIFTAGLGN